MYWMLMPLRRYAEFSGRSRRKEYWMFVLGYSLLLLGVTLIFGLTGGFSGFTDNAGTTAPNGAMMVFFAVVGLIGLAILVPTLAVQVRRLHDRDMSGWWLLGFYVASAIPFVGFIASIALLVITILPGTAGPNRFGPDPKKPIDTDVFA